MDLKFMIEKAGRFNLTLNQVGYMLYFEMGEDYPLEIDKLERADLYARKLIHRDKICEEWEAYTQPVKVDRFIKFKFDDEVAKVVVLMDKVLRNPDVGEHTKDKIAAEFQNNETLGSLFMTWYCLFPTEGRLNKGWDDLFGVKYTGYTIRIFTTKHSNLFKRVARKNVDMTVFIFATYWYMRKNIKFGKAYIPKMSGFTESWEIFYDAAVDLLKDKSYKEIMDLFTLDADANASEKEINDKTVKQIGLTMD